MSKKKLQQDISPEFAGHTPMMRHFLSNGLTMRVLQG